MRVVLASQSPARLLTLQRAGLRPDVVVSGVDEAAVSAPSVAELVVRLAAWKGRSVAERLDADAETVVLACDSLLELDGHGYGKPPSAAVARQRWRAMRGRTGTLHTGHYVARLRDGARDERLRVGSTQVTFAELSDAEIDAYVATGEPQRVAGAFTLDSLGGAYVTSIVGDPHNVVGISLPLLRVLLAELGIGWTQLVTADLPGDGPS